MHTSRIRVAIADDSAFVRKVLREALSAPDIEIVGSAMDGLQALELATEARPDILCLDLEMPNLDGIGVLEALRKLSGAPLVIAVTASMNLAAEARARGAFDVIPKPVAVASSAMRPVGTTVLAAVRNAARSSGKS